VYEMYAENDEENLYLPKKTVIFVDELNKYAPSGSKGSAIVQQILEVAERGRSIGVVLFSAQQFLSAVHSRVPGNAATQVLGRNGSAELASPEYRFLDSDVKGNVTRLAKGELLLSHAVFRQPIKINFPMPAYRQLR
ncbi:MAG TPA: ATP-binding protein, partial [Chthonomonadales bacterium]|nr:ATP-binding protein [Chthonomonadales bacterium]